jgi:UDP-glucose 4-epimerase
MNSNNIIEFINKNEDKHLITNRIGSTEKAKDELGFEVHISLEDGLKKVIDWRLGHTA